MKKELTIKDVAQRGNVSIATVSRVLNSNGRVSEATRRKILKIVDDMSYVQNNLAVSMVIKKTNILVVMVPDIFTRFYAEVIQGAEGVAKEAGFSTLVFSTKSDSKEEMDFLNGRFNKMVDGVVAIPSTNNPNVYKNFTKPIILIDRYIEGLGYDGVVIDNFGGSYNITQHLIKKGHRKIALITGPNDLNVGKERLWGYQQAHRDNGVELNQDYCFIGDWYEDNGYESVKKILSLSDRPTAIYAANCSICDGVIKAFHDYNVSIYHDISLVGFDNTVLTEFVTPKVTVVNRPTFEMGKVATQMLIDKINKKETGSQPKKITLQVEILDRGSVKQL